MKQLNTNFIAILIWATCLSQAIFMPSFAMDGEEKQRKIRRDEDEPDFVEKIIVYERKNKPKKKPVQKDTTAQTAQLLSPVEKKLQFLRMDIANMKIMATVKDLELQEQIYSDAQELIQELLSPNNSLSARPVEITSMLKELNNLVDKYVYAYGKRRNQTELEPAAIYLPKERGDIEDTLKRLEQEVVEFEQIDFVSNSEQISRYYAQAYVLHNKVMEFFNSRGNYLDQAVQNRLKTPITFIKNSLHAKCELLRQQETNTPKASSKNIHDPIQEKLGWFRVQSNRFANDVGSDFYELLAEVTECRNEFFTFLDHNVPQFNETHEQMATIINDQFAKAIDDLQLLINMKEMREQEMEDEEPEQYEDEFTPDQTNLAMLSDQLSELKNAYFDEPHNPAYYFKIEALRQSLLSLPMQNSAQTEEQALLLTDLEDFKIQVQFGQDN